MRRRALHCLRHAHWDLFERHVLRLMADHAPEIGAVRRRVVATATDPRAGESTRRDLEGALDGILSTFTPEHVALAKPLLDPLGAPTPVNLLAGLLSRAMEMLHDMEGRVAGGRSSSWRLSRGMYAMGLTDREMRNLFLDRAEIVVLGSPPEVVRRMATIAAMGDPEGQAIREAGLHSRRARARHSVRATIRSAETALTRSSWIYDEMVTGRMRLETWSLGDEGPDATLDISMKVVLEGIAEWSLTTRVRDHGILSTGTSNRISRIRDDGSILIGRRIDRDARGLPEDHASMAAAPLVAALRWRANPGEVPVDPAATVHLEEDVRLSDEVVVHARTGSTCWIDVDQPLPDTVIAAMEGRPITDLVAHPWLDPRIIVRDSIMSSRGARFLVDMPRARLMPVDADDGDPLEEWRTLQNQQCLARDKDRRERRRAERVRADGRAADAVDTYHARAGHAGDASRATGTNTRSRRGVSAIRTAVALLLLMVIAAALAVLTR